jgi:plastocyanin domain-containing protein
MWLINSLGIALMGFIVWWFWLWKPKQISGGTNAVQRVVVENGSYQPANLVVPVGRETTLHFLRKDPSPCSSPVVFPQWDLSAELPLNEEIEVTITPPEIGVFPFTCQMQMYRGDIHVVGDYSEN